MELKKGDIFLADSNNTGIYNIKGKFPIIIINYINENSIFAVPLSTNINLYKYDTVIVDNVFADGKSVAINCGIILQLHTSNIFEKIGQVNNFLLDRIHAKLIKVLDLNCKKTNLSSLGLNKDRKTEAIIFNDENKIKKLLETEDRLPF